MLVVNVDTYRERVTLLLLLERVGERLGLELNNFGTSPLGADAMRERERVEFY